MMLYFASYVPVIDTTNPLHSLGRPFEVVLFAAVFSGSALGYPAENDALRIAMIVACAILGIALWSLILRKFVAAKFRSTDPLLWFTTFLIVSGLLAALSRLDTGAIQAMTPRYHVNSCLIIASCALMLVTGKEGTWLADMTRRYLPLLAFAGLVYVAVSTLTLWRMHSLYIERTRGVPRGDQPSSFASSVISIAPSAFDTGQPAFALLASSINCASLMPGTLPRSVSALFEISWPPLGPGPIVISASVVSVAAG